MSNKQNTSIMDIKQKIDALPEKDKCQILMAINTLEMQRISGKPPTPTQILRACKATGYLELAMDCYGAQLQKQSWH